MAKKERDYKNMNPEMIVDIGHEYRMSAKTAAYLQKTYGKVIEPNTMLVDLKENDIYQTWIDVESLPYENLTMARYQKALVYTLVRKKNDDYEPINWPAFRKENKLPEELYRHLKCPEANILFQIPQGILDKINTTILVVLGIVALVICWFLMQG